MTDIRPPITYETTDVTGVVDTHTKAPSFIVRLSKAKISVPRYSIQVGVPRDGRISPFVPVGHLTDIIDALTKIRDERLPAIEAELVKARAEADERQRRYQENQDRIKIDWDKTHKRGKKREFKGSDDMRKAQKQSERAKADQARVVQGILGGANE